jgi:hypothetical protein
MALKPEISLTVGLATGAMVYGIFVNGTPTVADVRKSPANDKDAAAAEKSAAWMSAAVVGAVSLIAKDPTVFIIGGSMTVALAWWYRHANMVEPEYGMAVPKGDNINEMDIESNMGNAESYENEPVAFAF